uniref:Uncharacterized protein n=1 Tax=Moniliophthora roreri TaxID=221103 RepID=A0A0W0GFF9_MONRR
MKMLKNLCLYYENTRPVLVQRGSLLPQRQE